MSGLYNSESQRACAPNSIKPGMIIAYHLLPKDMPINPNKIWRGKVMQYNELSIRVETLEPGYEGLTEIISYEQVIGMSQS
jgi:hypothetical protein